MSAPAFAPRGPAELQHYLDVKAQELDQLSKSLQAAHNDLEEAEEAWDQHYDDVLATIEEDTEPGKQLPGEDIRISRARREGNGRDLWHAYRRADRKVKRLEKEGTQAGTVISACQSEAKLLLTESRTGG